jgi:hypothetical protein
MFCSICNWAHSSLLNLDVKWGSWSKMILWGIPKCGNMWVAYSVAMPSESMSFLQGWNFAALVQLWSIMVRIKLYPFEGGRSTIRSHVMVSKGCAFGLMVIGYIGILGFVVFDFVSWHFGHPLTYCVTNLFMSSHQYSCSIVWSVFEILGCPAVMWSWYVATSSLLKASFATMTMRPWWVQRPKGACVSPLGFARWRFLLGGLSGPVGDVLPKRIDL